MSSKYIFVSGCIFGVVAVGQALRALNQVPVQIGSFEVPVWASWVAAIVTGSLCVWAFRSRAVEQVGSRSDPPVSEGTRRGKSFRSDVRPWKKS